MRTEQQMLDLILSTARDDDRIRAVILQGSRANPNAPRDFFQDFDILYLVTDVTPYRRNLDYIQRFGELMILQLPDDMEGPPPASGSYCYLMQFMDGNRLDLAFFPLDKLDMLEPDSLSVLLLDKDNRLPAFPPADESTALPSPPTQKAFDCCCNEFWWCGPYVAKGLWRRELPYARHMLDVVLREELHKMLAWQIGVQTAFKINPGKLGKYFQKFLPPAQWRLLKLTYAPAGYAQSWRALFCMGELFRQSARIVAAHFGFTYPDADDQRVTAHLRHVHALPRDAKEIY